MRLHRITLNNFKGVASASVTFADEGVTIVEGDNEAGKSSLLEAFDFLLSEKSSAKSRRVIAAKPIGQDVGPEAEAELTIGGHRLTIRKRWLVSPETILTLHGAPDVTLTGGDGHDRLAALITEHLDEDLLDALRVLQGTKLTQASLASQALSLALDTAGGVDASGQLEDGVWGRIVAERERYWTPTGQVKVERRTLDEDIDVATRQRDEVARALAELDDDVARVERMTHDVARRRERRDSLAPEFDELEQLMSKVTTLAGQLESAELKRRQAETDAQLVEQEAAGRRSLIETVAARETVLNDLEGNTQVDADQERLSAAVELATVARDAADENLRRVQSVEQDTLRDVKLLRDLLDLELLRERWTRYETSQAALTEAEQTLRSTTINADLLAKVETAFVDYLTASGMADEQAVAVDIDAIVPIHVSEDDTSHRIDADTSGHLDITTRTEIDVPGGGRITITPGRNVAEVRSRRLATENELRRLLDEAGVEDVPTARLAERARADAEGLAESMSLKIKEDLRDLTAESLSNLVAHLQDSTSTRREERPASPPLPEDLATAEAIAAEARAAVDTAEVALTKAQTDLDAAAQAQADARTEAGKHQVRLDHARTERDLARVGLEAARASKADDTIAAERSAATENLRQAEEVVIKIEQDLRDLDADTIRVRFENVQGAVRRAEEEISDIGAELQRLRIELKVRGERGLASELDDLDRRLEGLLDEKRRVDMRANAAELLYQTFAKHRAAAQERYRAPLKEAIERLGRIVFGEDVSVTLSDDLTIAERTLDGRTVPFDRLSIGAQEQLGVLARLACATLVGDQGGAPVILDDALGWSDPARLGRMGAALNVAGRTSQVIVLTCFPDRYAAVGDARVVRISA